jgi:hypothetical protein
MLHQGAVRKLARVNAQDAGDNRPDDVIIALVRRISHGDLRRGVGRYVSIVGDPRALCAVQNATGTSIDIGRHARQFAFQTARSEQVAPRRHPNDAAGPDARARARPPDLEPGDRFVG